MKIFFLENKKSFCAFVFNFAILILEIIALFLSVAKHGSKVFLFYTENSNYFALLVSLIFCVAFLFCSLRNMVLPYCIYMLRYLASVCLTITLIVSVFIIIPMQPQLFSYMLFEGSCLYHHLLCPILSLISFLLFEKVWLSHSSIFYAITPTLIYGIVLVILNLARIITGPYPFFYFYQIPWHLSLLAILGIVAISFMVSFSLCVVHRKALKHIKRVQHPEKNENF